MARLVIKNILLASYRDRVAAKIEFAPTKNYILGANGIGKSIIMKSIPWVFGASPKTFTPRWTNSDPVASIEFLFSNTTYFLTRHKDRYALRSVDENLDFSDSKSLWDFLSQMFGVRGFAPHKNTKNWEKLHSQHILSSYYIDQDDSWNEPWVQFHGLNYFSNYKIQLFEFRIGVQSFSVSQQLQQLGIKEKEMKPLNYELAVANSALTFASIEIQSLAKGQPASQALSAVAGITDAYQKLHSEQTNIERDYNALIKLKAEIESEFQLNNMALSLLKADKKIIEADIDDERHVVCPTCNHIHGYEFAERYAFEHGERQLRINILDLEEACGQIDADIESKKRALAKVEAAASDLLGAPKDLGLSVREIIELESVSLLQEKARSRISILEDLLAPLIETVANLESDIAADRKNLNAEALPSFFEKFDRYCHSLNVNNSFMTQDHKKRGNTSSIQGNEKSRALLAFYGAMDYVGCKVTDFEFPLLIDTPKQQDPDELTEKRIARFLDNTVRMNGGQLIAASTPRAFSDNAGNSIKPETEHGTLFLKREFNSIANEIEHRILGGLES